jgi:hypothetical protein
MGQATPDQKPAPAAAAATPSESADVTGPTAFVQAEGNRSNMGVVTTYDFDLGYKLNSHLSVDVGVPVYAVRSPFSIVANHDYRYTNILGTPYFDVRYDTKHDKTNITTILTAAIGLNEVKTFSTGRTTVDWFNHFDRNYQVLTLNAEFSPFLNFGAGTGSMDRQVMERPYELARPYETLGYMGNGEIGGAFTFKKFYRFEGSAYDILPFGPQKIYSRLVSPDSLLGSNGSHNRWWDEYFITSGALNNVYGGAPARYARDNGYGAYFSVSKYKNFTVQLGYTRSVEYRYDSAFLLLKYNFTGILRNLTVGD